MSINALGKVALCAAASLSLSGSPADATSTFPNGAEQILHNISVSTDSELCEVETINVSVEGEEGINYDYQRDIATGTARYSLDGGKTWLEVDESAPAEIQDLHAATFETNGVNLDTEIDTFDFGDGMLLMYDEATGEMLESTDDGKTWHDVDSSVSIEMNDLICKFDEATGEVLESTDGGKTWHASDASLSVATEEDANGEMTLTVTNADA